jgi:hypothetical protein
MSTCAFDGLHPETHRLLVDIFYSHILVLINGVLLSFQKYKLDHLFE